MSAIPPGTDLCKIPAGRPPTGTVPNLVDPESLTAATIGISVALLVLLCAFITARVWTNRHKWRLSDYVSVAAFILQVGFIALILAVSPYDRHQWNVPVCWFNARYLQLLYAEVVVFCMTLLLSKSAIFLLYRELFWMENYMRVSVTIGLTLTILLYSTAIPIASYFLAPHVGHSWESMLTAPSDNAVTHWGLAIGSGSIVLDTFIFILPLPVLFKMKLSLVKRLQLLVVFGTGFMGVIASVVAVYYRVRLLQDPSDSTWGQSAVALSNMIENTIAILVGCAPAFAGFLRLYIGDSVMWKSLRSSLRSTFRGESRGGAVSDGSKPGAQSPAWGTIGSPRSHVRPRAGETLGFTDSQLLKTDATTHYDQFDCEEHQRSNMNGRQDHAVP